MKKVIKDAVHLVLTIIYRINISNRTSSNIHRRLPTRTKKIRPKPSNIFLLSSIVIPWMAYRVWRVIYAAGCKRGRNERKMCNAILNECQHVEESDDFFHFHSLKWSLAFLTLLTPKFLKTWLVQKVCEEMLPQTELNSFDMVLKLLTRAILFLVWFRKHEATETLEAELYRTIG